MPLTLKEFIEDPKTILSTISGLILTVIAYFRGKRKAVSELNKTDAEGAEIRVKTKREEFNLSMEKEERYEKRIETLMKRIETSERIIQELKEQVQLQRDEIEELRAERNVWKTVHPDNK